MTKVLITGGASGVGRAMGEAFAREGREVWVTDIDPKALKDIPKTWKRALC